MIAGWQGYAAALVLGAAVGGLAVGLPQGWRHDAQLAGVQAEIERERAALAKARADAAAVLLARQASHQQAVADLDAHHTKELTNAQNEIDRLRDAVAAGQRLRVNATCPAAPAGVPTATGAAGVDDAAGARLTDAAERDYFVLRERIAWADAMIKGLQGYALDVCALPH